MRSTASPTVIREVRRRRTSWPRGTISLLIQQPTAEQPSAKTAGHFMIVSRFMPHARIAAISLSAESRENTSTLDTSSDSGIVHCSVSGKLTAANRAISPAGMPSMMYPTICTIRPIVSTKLRTKNASAKLERNDPKTYLSIAFKRAP